MSEKDIINEEVRDSNIEEFDLMVEQFMKGQMPAEEEKAFKEVLATNATLRNRARTIALMVKAMKKERTEEREQIEEEIGQTGPDKTLLFSETDSGTRISMMDNDVHYHLVNPHRYVSTTPEAEMPAYESCENPKNKSWTKLRRFKTAVAIYLSLIVAAGILYEIYGPKDEEPVVFVFAEMPTDSGNVTTEITLPDDIDVCAANGNLFTAMATDEMYSSVRTVALDQLMHSRGDASDGVEALMQLFDNVRQGQDLDNTTQQLSDLLTYACNGNIQLADSTAQRMGDLLLSHADSGQPILSDFTADIAWNLTFAYLKQNNGPMAQCVMQSVFGQCKDLPSEITGLMAVLMQLLNQ